MIFRKFATRFVLKILPAYNRGRLKPTKLNILLEKILFYAQYGVWANFKEPVTYFEIVNKQKFYGDYEKLALISDKFAVRNYVEETIGREYLNKIIDVADSPDKIDNDRYLSYPETFVAKPNMASKRVCINKVTDYDLFLKKTTGFMDEFGNRNNEFHYKHIEKKVIIEEWLNPAKGQLVELKCLVFNGWLGLIAHTENVYEKEQAGKSLLRFYDREWKEPPLQIREHTAKPVPKPVRLQEVIELSEKLSAGWPFMRVDWYLADGKLVFGEMTPIPRGGRSFNLNLEDHRFIFENYYKKSLVKKC